MIIGAAALPLVHRLTGGIAPASASPDGAAEFVQTLLAEAINVLQIPTEQKADRETGFRRLLLSYFDLPLITRLVVGRYWRKANDEQKQAFATVFEQHIVKVYTSQLGVYRDEKVEVRNVAARTDKDTIVGTEVKRDSDPPLRIDWLVRESDGKYHVIDVAAEGVSMMTTKRSEFSSVIARDGMDGLIEQLEALNARGETEIGES
jgi:phospholipid transport system substrate-binding protein